jgi:hypothetical protein
MLVWDSGSVPKLGNWDMKSKTTLSTIEGIGRATSPEGVLEVYEKALAQVGAEYLAVNFAPHPEERIEDVSLAWKVPPEWSALYSGENFFQRDPAVRHSRRTVLPFDWASAPYNPESEPHSVPVRQITERRRYMSLPIDSALVAQRALLILSVAGSNTGRFKHCFDAIEPISVIVRRTGRHA